MATTALAQDGAASGVTPFATTPVDRAPFIEKLCYGFGDTRGTIITGLIAYVLTFYCADVFGPAPKIIAIRFLSQPVFDAVPDPLIGIVTDRTHTRWGKVR